VASLSLLLAGTTLVQGQDGGCPHEKDWKPTNEQLQRALSDHGELVKKTRIEYEQYESTRSQSIGFTLEGFRERTARWPSEEKEWWGVWTKRPSGAANFCNADLRDADLEGRILDWADFSNANLSSAKLSWAELRYAELKAAILTGAQLDGADLKGANLNRAILDRANLDNAILSSTILTDARLEGTSVKETRLSYADLSNAVYVPRSQPPYFYVAGIRGLETVKILFGPGGESGLVQLRDLIQKAGLRDLERQATFAIERGKTLHALDRAFEYGSVEGFVEGFFRLMAFHLTTGYGLYPGRALKIIAVLWLLQSGLFLANSL
jgi:uncharacterized protein YjbI with pentapeptide repeats